MKYRPKYYPTRNEYDSDDISHLFNNIKRYESNRQFIRLVLFCIPIAIAILYFLMR
jgi:hypothetical protein